MMAMAPAPLRLRSGTGRREAAISSIRRTDATAIGSSRHSSGKSRALEKDAAPVYTLQGEARGKWEKEYGEFEAEFQTWQTARGADRGPKPREPRYETYWCDDCTIEAVAVVAQNNTGAAYIAD